MTTSFATSTSAARTRGRRSRLGAVVAVALASSLAVACGGGSSDGADGPAPDRPSTTVAAESGDATRDELEVEVTTETFVDPSRPTDDATGPDADERTIETTIAAPTSGGPYPLVVLSHGFGGHPEEFTETIPMWAASGFVVAAPAFPLTNGENPTRGDNLLDVEHQPGDVSFVIDQVLAANDDEASALHGRVDPDAVGLVGHSLGGATTWAATFHTAAGDPRVDAAVIFAGVVIDLPDGTFDFLNGPPLLVFHGDADDVPMEPALDAYEQAASPKWFVELLGATHVPPFTDDESPYDDLVNTTVLDFFHGTLDGDRAALDRVTADATDPGRSKVLHD